MGRSKCVPAHRVFEVSTLLEILPKYIVPAEAWWAAVKFQPFLRFYRRMGHGAKVVLNEFQPFLRFYQRRRVATYRNGTTSVSTLLEILLKALMEEAQQYIQVSTLLEILPRRGGWDLSSRPSRRFNPS